MRKLLFLICSLALTSEALRAQPQWHVVMPTPEGDFMVDTRSIERHGDLRRFKSMRDYTTEQSTYDGKAYRSTLAVIEMDCRANEAIVLEVGYYTGRQLSGSLAYREADFHIPQPIDKRSPIQRYAQRLCQ